MNTISFTDIINSGTDPVIAIQSALDDLNQTCRTYRNSPRDAGVVNPEKIATDPLKVQSVDLEDAEIGHVVINGGGMPSPVTVQFSADETLSDWVNFSLLDSLIS